MAYTRSPPQSPGSQEDWEPKSAIKTYSTSSRSQSHRSRTHSISSTSSRSQNSAHYEASARTYYIELRKYLSSVIAKEQEEGVQPQRESARQKLARLNSLQFHELAMDVYDETCRRILNDKLAPFLPVREEFHPRRNQARQKLATLPTPRFQDLASDVFYELTRRYPQATDGSASHRPPVPPVPNGMSSRSGDDTMSNTPAIPQASHATNIVPIKGTINVESFPLSDDEKDYMLQRNGSSSNSDAYNSAKGLGSRTPNSGPPTKGGGHITTAESESNFQSLDSLMTDLGNMVSTKSPGDFSPTRALEDDMPLQPSKSNGAHQAELEKIRNEYEYKIAAMTKRIQQLENETTIARERQNSAHSEMEHDLVQLRKMEQERQSRLKQLQEEYNRLDDSHRQLEREHRGLKNMVDEVKENARELLEQIKVLSTKNDEIRSEKERTDSRVRQLTKEVDEWQKKYEKSRLELRTLKAESLLDSGLPIQDITKDAFLKPTPGGAVSHNHVILYQTAVDQLLKTARSSKPSEVLIVMQSIVTACKKITTDVEALESRSELPASMQSNLYSLKNQFSTALANLLTAAKNHANSMGISPVSLLDAAAGHLTVAVVDVVKLLGMARGSDDDADLDDVTPKTAVRSEPKAETNGPTGVLDPEQLSDYLKEETDKIVETIQQLLGALRSPSQISKVFGIISAISKIVSGITKVSEDTLSSGPGYRFRKQGELVLSDLSQSRQKLLDIRDTSFARSPETASAAAKRDLAKEAYEIAKYTKELINIFDA